MLGEGSEESFGGPKSRQSLGVKNFCGSGKHYLGKENVRRRKMLAGIVLLTLFLKYIKE